jgi:hypothetical protein
LLEGPGGDVPEGRRFHIEGTVAEKASAETAQSMEKIAVASQK